MRFIQDLKYTDVYYTIFIMKVFVLNSKIKNKGNAICLSKQLSKHVLRRDFIVPNKCIQGHIQHLAEIVSKQPKYRWSHQDSLQ